MKTQMLISRAPGNSSIFSLFGIFRFHFRSYASGSNGNIGSFPRLEKLVLTRCKSGNLTVEEALGYFNFMIQMRPIASIWTFTHLLSALSKKNRHSTVVSMYREMVGRRDLRPEVIALNVVIKSFCSLKEVKLAFSVLATMIKTALKPDAYTLCSLLHGLCNEGSMVGAVEFLRKLEEKDPIYNEVFYAIVINGFCKAGETQKALKLLKRMCNDERIKPQQHCFSVIINGLCKEGRIDEALSLFQDMINYGYQPDVVSYTFLIHRLCKFGCWEEAMRFLVNMLDSGISPDIYTYNTLVYGLCHSSQWSEASKLFKKMKDQSISPDVITYSILVDALCKERRTQEALVMFSQMIRRDLCPNIVTYSSLLNGLCLSGQLKKAKSFCDYMVIQDIFPNTVTLGGLLNAFCEKGMMDKAQKLFQEMFQHGKELGGNVITYNILIKGYCLQAEMDKAHEIFEQMTSNGIVPDNVSYCTLVGGYIKVGRIDVALKLLKDMIQKGFLHDHINVMRRILKKIRAKRLKDIRETICDLEPSHVVTRCLKSPGDDIKQLEQEDVGDPNICASLG